MTELRKALPVDIHPGALLLFRNAGTGEPKPIQILQPGQVGQCYGTLLTSAGNPHPQGHVAVCPHCELWTDAS